MKKLLTIVILTVATSTSFAGQHVDFGDFNSVKTRTQVKIELAQAKTNSTFNQLHSEYVDFINIKSSTARKQVITDLAQAKFNGEYEKARTEFVN